MWPLVEFIIQPKSRHHEEKLRLALSKLAGGDPTFAFQTDGETGETTLTGTDECHLNTTLGILKETYNIPIEIVGRPQVAYRETLVQKAEISYTHKRVENRAGEYARVKILFEPGIPGSGFQFEIKASCGKIPSAFAIGVERGLEQSNKIGPLAGFPMIDVKATLIDGAYHDVDSSPLTFEIAAKAAFRDLRKTGFVRILEPVVKVQVSVPTSQIPDILSDLDARFGDLLGTVTAGQIGSVTALVPLARMFGYSDSLHSLSNGLGRYVIEFDHYQVVALSDPPDDLFPSAVGMHA